MCCAVCRTRTGSAGNRRGTGRRRPRRPGSGARNQAYDRVVTKEAKSDDGIFTVHRIKDRIYYEIPRDRLGREFLWVSQIAKTTLGAGYGGQAAGNRVVKWERRGDRIMLRAVSYDVIADPSTPIARAVEAANYNPIVAAFNIEALGKDEAAVIEVTRLFTTDVPEFSGRTRVGARAFDTSRSFVERAVSFPENIEVEATHTYNNPPQEAAAGGRGAPPGARRPWRDAAAPRNPQRADAFQHGAAAGKADAGAPLRRPRRLLLHGEAGLRQGRASRAAAPLHHPLAAGEEGSEGGDLRAGQADRLLDRSGDADEVGAVS